MYRPAVVRDTHVEVHTPIIDTLLAILEDSTGRLRQSPRSGVPVTVIREEEKRVVLFIVTTSLSEGAVRITMLKLTLSRKV